jgi:hypothetical protein
MLALVLLGCQEQVESPSAVDEIESNDMNFPRPTKRTFGELTFQLSALFRDTMMGNISSATEHQVYYIDEIKSYLIIEKLDGPYADISNGIALLESRTGSLFNEKTPVSVSVFKPIPDRKVKGFMGSACFETEKVQSKLIYYFATLEFGSIRYFMQLSGKEAVMKHFYDDFLKIVRSAHVS